MQASDIKAGRYYVTSTNQVRKVTNIEGGKVTYSSRGKRYRPDNQMWGATTSLANFAAAVDREVTADWDPDYPDRME